ncbi:MAG TPA: hypothetical protein VD902_14575 [Symbiobacteriaceae bacterium]|nr:hypothetical protein [Symbiobacteriaceae bacterium]
MAAGMDGYQGPVLRPLEFGELLDQTFRVYRRGFKSFFMIGLVTAIPAVIANGINTTMQASVLRGAYFLEATSVSGVFKAYAAILAFTAIYLVGIIMLYPLMQGSIIAICSRTYLGRPTTFGQALRIAASRYWALLGTAVLKGLAFLVSIPALIIGGLIILSPLTVPAGMVTLGVYMAFPYHAIVVEQVGGGPAAFSRSFRLVGGHFWRLLGLGVVFQLMIAVITGGLSFILSFTNSLYFSFDTMVWMGWAGAILGGLASALTMPFNMLGLTLAYYDVRVRKEGFDLEMLAQSQISGQVGV